MRIKHLINDRASKKDPFLSFEFFPPKEKTDWPAFFETINHLKKAKPLFASVTYGAGGSTQNNTLEITARLSLEGMNPMAHLTCVGATSQGIEEYVSALNTCGVHNILALRGDAPKDALNFSWESGDFVHAGDLAHFVREHFPEFGIGAAAYPTPHPESRSFSEDRRRTAEKLGLCDFAITQVFFDPREYFEYVRQMRQLGVDKPIIPGILPIQTFESLKRVLALSGCNIPAKFFLSLEKANKEGGSEAVREAGLDFAAFQIQRLIEGGAPGVHLYTLNKSDMCLHIAEKVGLM